MSPAHGDHEHHHHYGHGHGDGHGHHHHQQHHGHHQHRQAEEERKKMMLPEELAEEEDVELYGFGPYRDDHDHDNDHHELSDLGLWLRALGCSLLVSLASLICLIILPVIFIQGKPSKAVVDSLALFGAGAMLGDGFLHQLPHSFDKSPTNKESAGGGRSHSHADHVDHAHHGHIRHNHKHAHSLKDLSVGLSVLAGIVLFLLVEKLVRYVEENSGGATGHGHHHHHHKSNTKLKNDDDAAAHDNSLQPGISDDSSNVDNATQPEIRKLGFKYLHWSYVLFIQLRLGIHVCWLCHF